MTYGCGKSDSAILAGKPTNKAEQSAAVSVERRAGAKGNTHQQSTYWTQSQGRVSKALERIRRLVPLPTRGRSRMRESRTYGSGRGACDEKHVPTATKGGEGGRPENSPSQILTSGSGCHRAAQRLGTAAEHCEARPTRIGGNKSGVARASSAVAVTAQNDPFDELAGHWIRDGRAGMDRGCRRQDRLHRARQPLGERLHRELQRPPSR